MSHSLNAFNVRSAAHRYHTDEDQAEKPYLCTCDCGKCKHDYQLEHPGETAHASFTLPRQLDHGQQSRPSRIRPRIFELFVKWLYAGGIDTEATRSEPYVQA